MPLSTILDGVLPVDLGLPEIFEDFRQIQREMADYAIYGPGHSPSRRIAALGAPTGTGKELAAQLIGRMSGAKYVVVTATRTLEDQAASRGYEGLVNVRGRSNYTCHSFDDLYPDDRWTCEEGLEKNCPFYVPTTPDCNYGEWVERAKEAPAVLTNYQYWLSVRARNPGALESERPVGMLICDEAHKAVGELARFLAIWVSNDELYRHVKDQIKERLAESKGREWGLVTAAWNGLLTALWLGVRSERQKIAANYKSEIEAARASQHYRRLQKLEDNVARVVSLSGADAQAGYKANWLWRQTNRGIAFDCIWPGKYTERYLFSGVASVVLMSATLRPKLLSLLSIPATDYWYKEWPRVFPAAESPVYWLPTGRMGHKTDEEEKLRSVAAFDRTFEEWREYKGIVHTNSYKRAEWLQQHSQYGRYMILHESGEANRAAEEYRERRPPVVLVSPSFSTGWDFPEEDVQWAVINKLPYPDRSDPVVLARVADDKDWYDYETMQTLVQTCGRQKRRPGQKSMTVITDDAIRNFRGYARRHASSGFKVLDAPQGEVPRVTSLLPS